MKALLVIDINDDYLEDYENFTVDYDLRADRKDDNVNESVRYVEDCELKPLPDKIDQGYPCSAYDEGYGDGHDRCIDEILGEE